MAFVLPRKLRTRVEPWRHHFLTAKRSKDRHSLPVRDTDESKALRRAVETFGSITALSQWLKVPADALAKWINGEDVPPRAVSLQIADVLGADKESTAASQSADTPTGVGLGMRVLIADDERDTLMTLGILLRSEGFDVELLHGGSEVPSAVRKFRPQAVLLDLGMPDRNGYEVATELTREYGSARPILIALTAHSSESDKRAAESCGFHHHVSKPYNPDRLLSLLASLNQKR
jgi:CheY-like chemotaxis protein